MKMLVFSAHSADFCSRSGGMVIKRVRKGDEVCVVSLSFGERSESGTLYTEDSTLSLEEVRIGLKSYLPSYPKSHRPNPGR